jgi:nucleoside-diphosphate-sugar epimerase
VLVQTSLKRGQAPIVGRGLSEWDHVHVNDLADLFILLAEAAVKNDKSLDSDLWGSDVYYLAEGGNHVWGEVSKWVAEDGFKKGYLKTKEVQAMEVDDAKEVAGFEAVSWGLNSRGQAKRARKFLGWKPKGRSLKDTIPLMIDAEAEKQGLKKGYAEKAAGNA